MFAARTMKIIPTAVESLKQNVLECGNLHRINDSEILYKTLLNGMKDA
jgi:hypothetical protein